MLPGTRLAEFPVHWLEDFVDIRMSEPSRAVFVLRYCSQYHMALVSAAFEVKPMLSPCITGVSSAVKLLIVGFS